MGGFGLLSRITLGGKKLGKSDLGFCSPFLPFPCAPKKFPLGATADFCLSLLGVGKTISGKFLTSSTSLW